MRNEDMENRLKTAVEHAVPDVLDGILSECGKIDAGPENAAERKQLDVRPGGRRRKRWMPAGSVAAVLILIMGSVWGMNWNAAHAVDSVIGIDVNPSVELRINKNEKVLAAEARNEDGKDILDGMDLRDTDLDVAVNALIGSMLKNGYIDELANSILVTVGSEDDVRGAELQQRLVTEINRILSSNAIDGAILSQKLTADPELTRLAADYGISEGKASLIREMISQNSLWTFDELAGCTINDLNLMASSRNTGLDHIKTQGAASDKAYIGTARACQIALAHAGLSESEVGGLKSEFDWEEGRPEYEVEFSRGKVEYEYEIDARTGEVLSFHRDGEDDRRGEGGRENGGRSDDDRDDDRDEEDREDGGGDADDTILRVPSGSAGAAYIGEEEAKGIALAKVPGASVTEFKLDVDDGEAVYEIELQEGSAEHEFEIDAITGRILKWESDEDEDGDEDED
ncbi:PepSY domain-containing protein [Bacilliculturomica massiliensis]|uniref:PepSY domain-containing protein n=1 Tax=Bacilliculturomica massiliensis TaxID=1917867 RepID=UPI00102FD9B6|nr:PepSY domain-containing protein [Bacilliculturomica massiliensis]